MPRRGFPWIIADPEGGWFLSPHEEMEKFVPTSCFDDDGSGLLMFINGYQWLSMVIDDDDDDEN